MKTVNLTATVKVEELSNIPHFESSQCYAVINLTNNHNKITTNSVTIKNNRAQFNNEAYKLPFKAQIDGSGKIISKPIQVTFYKKSLSSVKPEKLGDLTIDPSEFVNNSSENNEPGRYLLANAKANAIARISITVHGDKPDALNLEKNGLIQTTRASLESPKSVFSTRLSPLSKEYSTSFSCELPMMETSTSSKMPLKSATTLNTQQISDKSIVPNQINDTRLMMRSALEKSIGTYSNDILNNLFNKAYGFTWQLQEQGYDEFTPTDCIRDIVERNGNGWRKNDEGFDLVDISHTEYRDTLSNNKQKLKNKLIAEEDEDEWAEFEVEEDDLKSKRGYYDDGDEEEEMDDYEEGYGGSDPNDFYDLYSQRRSNRRVLNHRVKPLSETQVRDDLRSWHINVKS